jgi:hypothetical protein
MEKEEILFLRRSIRISNREKTNKKKNRNDDESIRRQVHVNVSNNSQK